MPNSRKSLQAALFALLWIPVTGANAELTVEAGHTPYAPINIKEQPQGNKLSGAERKELIQEFRGLLAMGARDHAYDNWAGRSMADCIEAPAKEAWKYKCEIMMGHGNGYYFFYGSGSTALLRQLDVYLPSSDEGLIKELKPTVRQLFGRRELVLSQRSGVQSRGPVHHWNIGSQTGDLFLDASKSPNGTVRFIWSRGTDIRTSALLSPKTDN